MHHPELAERVLSQGALQPDLYGDVDLTALPHRFTADPETKSSLLSWVADREPLLQDEAMVELMRTATMLGDVDADPYATLLDTHGLKHLIRMLTTACREGIEALPDAPEELRTFITSMEATPTWLDMDLVEEGARYARVPAAFMAPFITRGAFLATFSNTYAALPMTLTGALTGRRAARRVTETTSFFAITAMPGALRRHGIGFETTAHVRLMHSVVRYNALKRSKKWDQQVYGVPVPQVDQMPAGMINVYILAMTTLREGRTEWNHVERAVHEFTRYRCFLMGLPEKLLPSDPEGVVRAFNTRAATLRAGFDEATDGALVRSTLDAHLRPGHSRVDRAADRVENAWSRAFFANTFGREPGMSQTMGIRYRPGDKALVAATTPFILGRFLLMVRLSQRPALAAATDRYATRVLRRRLAAYGVEETMTEHHGRMPG